MFFYEFEFVSSKPHSTTPWVSSISVNLPSVRLNKQRHGGAFAETKPTLTGINSKETLIIYVNSMLLEPFASEAQMKTFTSIVAYG